MTPQPRPSETDLNVVPGGSYGPKVLTHGWELTSVLKFNTGEPVDTLSGSDSSGTGEYEDRGSIVARPRRSISSPVVDHSYAQRLNPEQLHPACLRQLR